MVAPVKKEIERKFRLIHPVSDAFLLTALEISGIEQCYLPVAQGEVRLRYLRRYSKSNTEGAHSFWLTAKSDGDLVRREEEIEIPEFIFRQMWSMNDGVISKIRHLFRVYRPRAHRSFRVELDVYQGKLFGLQTLECEFKSIRGSQSFQLPYWASGAIEVTNDSRFKNKNLARHPEEIQIPHLPGED